MAVLRALFRLYSYVFHLLLTLFLMGISLVALRARTDLLLGFLPWQGPRLSGWLLCAGLLGLIALLLSVAGKLRVLFLLWAVLVFAILFRGFVLSPYTFPDSAHFRSAVWLTIAALAAIPGAWPRRTRRPRT